MTPAIRKRIEEKVEFSDKAIAETAGYHSVDIKELHATNCPALFEYAKRMCKFENDRLSPIILTLLDVVGS